MQFNEKLKKLRLEKQMTQEELAKQIFVSRSAVAKWESGLGLPSEQSLELLARCFGVSTNELLTDPKTEAIIVNKNSTLSRQKIAIIGLIAFLGIIMIIVAILLPQATSKPKPGATVTPWIVTRELIFITEKDLQTSNLPIYSDSSVTDGDLYFAPSRTFVTYSDYTVALPALTLKVTINEIVHFEQIDFDKIYTSGFSTLLRDEGDRWILSLHGFDVPYAGIGLNLKYDNLSVSIKIIKRPELPVEGLHIGLYDDKETIGPGEKKPLYASVLPFNASYPDYEFSIEKILHPDGTKYIGVLSLFAYFDENYLSTTEDIEIGSAIHIVATTRAEGFRSNTLVVYVTRVPIERISLQTEDSYYPTSLSLGESLSISNLKVMPDNATYNVLKEHAELSLLTPDLATFEKTDNGWLLTVTDDIDAAGSVIQLEATTPEGYTKIFEWGILPIYVTSIMLINADTGEELDDVTYLTRGSTLRLKAVVMPENATYDYISYNCYFEVNNFSRYVTLSDDGILSVTENTIDFDSLVGYINAYAGRYHTKSYTIIIQKVPVESVTLNIKANEIQKGVMYFLTNEVYPANADVRSRKYYILENIDGISLSWNMLYVTTAPGGTVFHVQAEFDGVKSNIIELTVQTAPLQELQIGFDTLKPIKGQLNQIDVYYYPLYADFKITFKILDDVAGIYIIGDQIFITPEVKTGTVFRIQAYADGIESNILTLTVVDAEIP